MVLREPISRAYSAFNFRWLTWLCGKLLWTRADCWAGVTSEQAVRAAQVGPFQMHAALKLWRTCGPVAAGSASPDGWSGPPSLKCLQQDYTSKLRNKTGSELAALRACTAEAEAPEAPASIDWVSCLHLSSVMLGPKQVHKVLEDSSFVFRSMYAVHLRSWLRLYPPAQLHVTDPAFLLGEHTRAAGMHALARFAGLSTADGLVRGRVLEEASPGAKAQGATSGVHENGRRYILGRRGPPAEVARSLREWLRPHQCDLAGLLLRHGLARPRGAWHDEQLPWLSEELASSEGWAHAEGPGGGVCAGVISVDQWFVGK